MSSWNHAIRQTRSNGHCTISQLPYKAGGGISLYRGPRDARLVHIFNDAAPIQFVTFGGLQGAQQAMDEILGPVMKVICAPANSPQNLPRMDWNPAIHVSLATA